MVHGESCDAHAAFVIDDCALLAFRHHEGLRGIAFTAGRHDFWAVVRNAVTGIECVGFAQAVSDALNAFAAVKWDRCCGCACRPAFGYRIDYKNRSMVISGDTATSPNLVRVAQNADLLIHEALAPNLVGIMGSEAESQNLNGVAHIFHDIPDYHTSPSDAASEAQQAHVGALALTHLIPPIPVSVIEGPFLGDARNRYDGPLWIMRDGDIIILPAGGGIERRHVLR